jgi:hypothetical protein
MSARRKAYGARSLKTEQDKYKKPKSETSISDLRKDQKTRKKDVRDILELNQMESLILAQDERWRHA